MKTVGISVGHYGEGTGCSYQDLDEWSLCLRDAQNLERAIDQDTDFPGSACIIFLNKEAHPWNIVHQVFNLGTDADNMDIRAAWAQMAGCDLLIELHYNSNKEMTYTTRTGAVKPIEGHQCMIFRQGNPESLKLAQHLSVFMNQYLGTRDRGIKKRGYYILRQLDRLMPTVMIEPAFIFEKALQEKDWHDKLCQALKSGLLHYLNP